ncbi:FlgB family protein [Paracoccus onubensis]|uniref:Flagellar basal body rod protein FlgB n=1 Tax=Paracoccus onubensis TaxID=1675788 RepID=A0A418SVD0_9RHOB|nr:FlgB family protein [Paracoccus onubensis]RJE84907.1 FlgB family protein [Paracoccus onubensis]
MFERIELMSLARASTSHAALRNAVVARNIANADTPGFTARDLQPFAESYRQNHTAPLRRTRAGHIPNPAWSPGPARELQPEAEASPNGNTVSLEEEMFKLAEVKRRHELSVGIYQSALNLMRTSIDRRN